MRRHTRTCTRYKVLLSRIPRSDRHRPSGYYFYFSLPVFFVVDNVTKCSVNENVQDVLFLCIKLNFTYDIRLNEKQNKKKITVLLFFITNWPSWLMNIRVYSYY